MQVSFRLNGQQVTVNVENNELLVDTLRNKFMLTSIKKGCDFGECGTCTVLLNKEPVRSCLIFSVELSEVDEIVTVEGLCKNGELHPIQKAFAERYGFQCGYCTPAMILITKALLDSNPNPSISEIKDAFEGNLCRCTGYEQIIESVIRAAELIREGKAPLTER